MNEPKSSLLLVGVLGTAVAKWATQENAAIFAGFATGLFMLAQTVRLLAISFKPSNQRKTSEND